MEQNREQIVMMIEQLQLLFLDASSGVKMLNTFLTSPDLLEPAVDFPERNIL